MHAGTGRSVPLLDVTSQQRILLLVVLPTFNPAFRIVNRVVYYYVLVLR